MSVLIYNGLVLSPIKTYSITKIPRYSDDILQYMWTDVIINVGCIYNPGYTSYINNSLVPIPSYAFPATTDVAIRSFLLQPRKSLYYAETDSPIINIPASDFQNNAIDAQNGPFPQVHNITAIAG